MNVVIFEDDNTFADRLKTIILRERNEFNVSLVTADFEGLCRYIELLEKPALFILDIMLGGQDDGFKMADIIAASQPNAIIIFITDYPDKILSNSHYKIRAFNILLKSSDKLEQELILTLREALKFTADNNILIYSDKFTAISINIEGIHYAETVNNANKIRVHHHSGDYEMRTSLTKFLKQLPDYFVRCHHAYIVNAKQISRVDYTASAVHLLGGQTCYYSPRNKGKLLKALSGQALER